MDIQAGFLIVKTFRKLYQDYATRYNLTHDLYAIPRIDKTPDQAHIRYQGLDRDPLEPVWLDIVDVMSKREEEGYVLAGMRLDELEEEGKSQDGLTFELADAIEVYEWLGTTQRDYEIIWARIVGSNLKHPSGFRSAGYEPSFFIGHNSTSVFSASCDCMLFPRWHGTDAEGELFQAYFKQLNGDGLFDAQRQAEEFLRYYLSFDWTETGEYEIAEVFLCEPTRT